MMLRLYQAAEPTPESMADWIRRHEDLYHAALDARTEDLKKAGATSPTHAAMELAAHTRRMPEPQNEQERRALETHHARLSSSKGTWTKQRGGIQHEHGTVLEDAIKQVAGAAKTKARAFHGTEPGRRGGLKSAETRKLGLSPREGEEVPLDVEERNAPPSEEPRPRKTPAEPPKLDLVPQEPEAPPLNAPPQVPPTFEEARTPKKPWAEPGIEKGTDLPPPPQGRQKLPDLAFAPPAEPLAGVEKDTSTKPGNLLSKARLTSPVETGPPIQEPANPLPPVPGGNGAKALQLRRNPVPGAMPPNPIPGATPMLDVSPPPAPDYRKRWSEPKVNIPGPIGPPEDIFAKAPFAPSGPGQGEPAGSLRERPVTQPARRPGIPEPVPGAEPPGAFRRYLNTPIRSEHINDLHAQIERERAMAERGGGLGQLPPHPRDRQLIPTSTQTPEMTSPHLLTRYNDPTLKNRMAALAIDDPATRLKDTSKLRPWERKRYYKRSYQDR